jgi:hypothetical protein
MNQNTSTLPVGARVLSADEASSVDLGALTQLQGTWKSEQGLGWNVIAVPGPPFSATNTKIVEFVLEVIPYIETLTFTPVVAASNRGPFNGDVEDTQNIVGLMYEQSIISTCTTDFCNSRGFASGTQIHAETGLFLNVQNLNSGFDIVRLSTIPHGNSVLAPGVSSAVLPPSNSFFPIANTFPTSVAGPLPNGYAESQYESPQFANFDQLNPNSFLEKTLGTQQLLNMTTLSFSTKNNDGGILNIPFIQQNVRATDMEATFWIETIQNPTAGQPNILQLQYTQTINLVFPPTGINVPVVWPHVTVNTLTKVC